MVTIDLGITGAFIEIGSGEHDEVLLYMKDSDGDSAAEYVSVVKLREIGYALLAAAGGEAERPSVDEVAR